MEEISEDHMRREVEKIWKEYTSEVKPCPLCLNPDVHLIRAEDLSSGWVEFTVECRNRVSQCPYEVRSTAHSSVEEALESWNKGFSRSQEVRRGNCRKTLWKRSQNG